MSLLESIRKDMLNAIKSGDKQRSQILKIVIAAIKNNQIESETELKDNDIEKILRKESKKIEDSIDQYQKMGREDLVTKEKADLEIIQDYLPDLMSDEEILKIVDSTIENMQASDMREMGKVMGAVMKKLEGKADGNTVKNIVQSKLSS